MVGQHRKRAAGPAAPPSGPGEAPQRVARSAFGLRVRAPSEVAARGYLGSLVYCGRTAGDSREDAPSEVGEINEKNVRVNEQIRISPVRLIQDDGEQIGIVSIEEARERADDRGMDLVEVAPDSRPPVVKMMDYGKFKYEAQRVAREARKKHHTVKVKEVKFRPGVEDHDYEFKTRHARRFLEEGNKVKLTMMFRGRQVTHPEVGLEVLQRVVDDLQDVGTVESQPSFEGRIMSMILAPLKTK